MRSLRNCYWFIMKPLCAVPLTLNAPLQLFECLLYSCPNSFDVLRCKSLSCSFLLAWKHFSFGHAWFFQAHILRYSLCLLPLGYNVMRGVMRCRSAFWMFFWFSSSSLFLFLLRRLTVLTFLSSGRWAFNLSVVVMYAISWETFNAQICVLFRESLLLCSCLMEVCKVFVVGSLSMCPIWWSRCNAYRLAVAALVAEISARLILSRTLRCCAAEWRNAYLRADLWFERQWEVLTCL